MAIKRAMPNAHALRKVGDVWRSHYWDEHYTVLSLNDDGSVTVEWHGNTRTGSGRRTTTHATPIDRGDQLITRTQPATRRVNTRPRRAA